MRFILASVIFLSLYVRTPAHAECYGDAAQAYGCGGQPAPVKSSSGDLARFGDDQVVIIPNTSYPGAIDSNGDLFTPWERRNMMRSIVLGQTRDSFSQGSMIRSMSAAERPLRSFSNRRIVTWWGWGR